MIQVASRLAHERHHCAIVGNDVVNKTYVDKSGKGVLGYVTNNTDTSLALSSFVTVNGMSITITPEVGRYYRFSTNVHFLTASAIGNCRCAIGVFRSTDLATRSCNLTCTSQA